MAGILGSIGALLAWVVIIILQGPLNNVAILVSIVGRMLSGPAAAS